MGKGKSHARLTPLTSQRFGLRTYQDSDDRDVVQDFLSLLRAHGADFHASLRELSNFHPSKIDDDAYRRSFAKRWVANTTIDLKSDSAMRVEEGITAWLRTYAARATSADEKAAWEKDAPDGEWEEIRTVAMRAVNPRFVLRQWLLEETIKTVDEALKAKDVTGARKVLARVLDVGWRPSEPANLAARHAPLRAVRRGRRMRRQPVRRGRGADAPVWSWPSKLPWFPVQLQQLDVVVSIRSVYESLVR